MEDAIMPRQPWDDDEDHEDDLDENEEEGFSCSEHYQWRDMIRSIRQDFPDFDAADIRIAIETYCDSDLRDPDDSWDEARDKIIELLEDI
jgi:hypothetical protein